MAAQLARTQFQGNPFHLVTSSPWPLAIALALFSLTLSFALWRHGYASGLDLVGVSTVAFLAVFSLWCRDITAEGTNLGNHTLPVQRGISLGFIRFVISEVMFFFSIFWAYMHSSLAPSVELGSTWPPVGIESRNYREIPLLNSCLLLGSGATVTYAHHALLGGQRQHAIIGLFLTIALAVIFTAFQAYEYVEAPFTMSDSVYGSAFFFGTGFHGVHVIRGTLRLTVGLARLINYHLSDHAHVGLESGIIYYHRVDVVWICLYAIFYVWAA